MGRGAVLSILVVATATGCGGDENGSAAPAGTPPETAAVEALNERFELVNRADGAGAAWDRLHPAQQALVPRVRYVACADEAQPRFTWEVEGTSEEEVAIPGTNLSADAVAIEVSISVEGRDAPAATITAHQIRDRDRWVWILSDRDIETFVAGDCPR